MARWASFGLGRNITFSAVHVTELSSRHPSKNIRQMLTFGLIGLANTAAFFLIANGLNLFLDESVSAYLAYALLVPVSFFGHRRLTFKSDAAIAREWLKFCIVQALNLSLIWGVTTVSGIYPILSGWPAFGIISLLIPILNFVIFQIWVFARG
jgi:putative flippase GtrA